MHCARTVFVRAAGTRVGGDFRSLQLLAHISQFTAARAMVCVPYVAKREGRSWARTEWGSNQRPPACRTRLVLRHGAPAGANCALSSRFVTRTFATRRGGRPPFLSAIFPLESQKSLSRRPSGRRARILRRPRHFLVDQQCSEMRLRSSGSPPGWQAVAGRQTCASPATPRLRGRHGPRRPGPSTNLSPHAARYAGVPTGSPCVLVLGLCGLCRSNCRTMGLLRARRCDA
jgi:hypothetical protein